MLLFRSHSNNDLPENFFSAPPGSERKTSMRAFPEEAKKGRIFKGPEAFMTLLKVPPPFTVALELGLPGVDPVVPEGGGEVITSFSVPGLGFTPVSSAGRAMWGALVQGAFTIGCGG